jgi:hypothetical protein
MGRSPTGAPKWQLAGLARDGLCRVPVQLTAAGAAASRSQSVTLNPGAPSQPCLGYRITTAAAGLSCKTWDLTAECSRLLAVANRTYTYLGGELSCPHLPKLRTETPIS